MSEPGMEDPPPMAPQPTLPDTPQRWYLPSWGERLRLMHDVAAQFELRQDKDVFRVQIVVPL